MNNRSLFFFLFFLYSSAEYCLAFNQKQNPIVRVLLEKIDAPEKVDIELHAPFGFYLWKKQKPTKLVSQTIQIESNKGRLILHQNPLEKKNKKESTEHALLHITACKNQPITINNKQYFGACILKVNPEKQCYYLINNLPLEEYVYGVLVCESYAHWPLEMQKVQAVATRTFAHYHMNQAHKKKELFDLKNSIFHQRYDGTHQYDHLRIAVDQTASEVLMYKNEIALTMFDACCGGIIPSRLDTINFDQAPYLKRSKRCTFCKHFSLYRWKHLASLQELNRRLLTDKSIQKEILSCSPIKELAITKTDKAGSVSEMRCQTSKKAIYLPTHKIKNSLGKGLKSKFFTLEQKGDQLKFEGKGFGHGLGLCQHGARFMVDKKYSYKKILAFYFPQTKIIPFFKLAEK